MMERHRIIEAMTDLKLYGMRASFDEVAGKGLSRREDLYPLLASLIRAELTHRQSRSINYALRSANGSALRHRATANRSARGLTFKAKWSAPFGVGRMRRSD